jgi:hypothetical protein
MVSVESHCRTCSGTASRTLEVVIAYASDVFVRLCSRVLFSPFPNDDRVFERVEQPIALRKRSVRTTGGSGVP